MNKKYLAVRSLLIIVGILVVLLAPAAIWAQAQTENASILGIVKDASGAVISNATVTLTSPALQVASMIAKTDSGGNYKFLELPAPGVYQVTFEAAGFTTVVKQDVTLTVGFTAKVDGTLTVGAVTTSVVITSAGPVIDTVSTATTSILQEETLTEVPKSLGTQDLLTMAAGVTLSGAPDVGDSQLANAQDVITEGITLQPDLRIEGVNTLTAKEEQMSFYDDTFAIAEGEIQSSGNSADVGLPGVNQELVMKSGSNTFHGDAEGDFERPGFQGNNITPALAAPPNHLVFGNPLVGDGYYDYAADLGGHIIRDKLWIYGGISKQLINQGQANFFAAPNSSGCWTCAGAIPAMVETSLSDYNGKVSYQVVPSTKVIFALMYGAKYFQPANGSSSRPMPAAEVELQPGYIWKAEVQSVISPRFMIDGLFGFGGYHVTYGPESASEIGAYGFTKGSEFAGSPSEEELSTGLFTGPDSYIYNKPQNRYEMTISATYIPDKPHLGGKHLFTVATDDTWEMAATRVSADSPSGDYLLKFENGAPNEITIYNFPLPTSINNLNNQAFYATDVWSIKHVTFNLGVRGERYNTYYPTQSKPMGQFSAEFPAQTYTGVTLLTWTDVVPRIGATWDVAGNGKTVIKGFFGMFGDTMGDLFPVTFNPNAEQTQTYHWTGPCGPTSAVAPVEYACDATPAFLASLPSLTPISATGGTTQVLNPNLAEDKTREYDVRLERQIASNMAITAGYVYHSVFNNYPSSGNGVDIGHTYNVPLTFTDTFNGVSTPITLYTYAKGSGSIANEVVNTPSSRPDTYSTIIIGFTKRTSTRWAGATSYWITKNNRWINGTAGLHGDPNSWFYPKDETWNWGLNGNVHYHLPLKFILSSALTVSSGTPGQRTDQFSSSALIQGSETVDVGTYGQYRGGVISNLSVKAAKDFVIHEKYHLQANFQVFNTLNSSAAIGTNYLNSPSTFGVVTSLASPRVARIGALFSF